MRTGVKLSRPGKLDTSSRGALQLLDVGSSLQASGGSESAGTGTEGKGAMES